MWQPSGRDSGKDTEKKSGLDFLLREKKVARLNKICNTMRRVFYLHSTCPQSLKQLYLVYYITMDHLGFSFLLEES